MQVKVDEARSAQDAAEREAAAARRAAARAQVCMLSRCHAWCLLFLHCNPLNCLPHPTRCIPPALSPHPRQAYTLEMERLTDDNALLGRRLEQMELDLKWVLD